MSAPTKVTLIVSVDLITEVTVPADVDIHSADAHDQYQEAAIKLKSDARKLLSNHPDLVTDIEFISSDVLDDGDNEVWSSDT